MIEFRCWYCNRRRKEPKVRFGERITCGGCGYPLRVPRCTGGNCRIRTLTDLLVENLVYGGFGALMGMIPAYAWVIRMPRRGGLNFLYHSFDYWWVFPLCGWVIGIAAGNGWTRWLARLFRKDR
jgi:hypothetical protein